MNERDELYSLVENTFDDVSAVYEAVTTAVLAAGYRKPRTITTAEDLDALPAWSIVEANGACFVNSIEGNICWDSMGRGFSCSSRRLMEANASVTVIHNPEAAS